MKPMRHIRQWGTLGLALACLLMSAGCTTASGENIGADPAQSAAVQSSQPREAAELDLTDATRITLSGESASIEGEGAQVEDGVVTITQGGVYALSGTLQGRVIVNAGDEEVTVALNGADIVCSYGSPLYIYSAGTATLHLMEGTQNSLTDGETYTFADSLSSQVDEEPNACLYSKDDLVIQGAGVLTVNANYNNGITSKDTLAIYDSLIAVTAVNHGVNGKDSNTIDSAVLSVTCGGDAIRATNDTDDTMGWISLSNAELTLEAGEDGIQGETWVTVSGGSYAITTGGGSGAALGTDASAKGIKAGTDLTLEGGSFSMNCCDDAFHANGSVTVAEGSYTVATGDDAFHADETLTVAGGTIAVNESYEGLEGADVVISDGTISIVSSDDGVNAAGGNDGSGMSGQGMPDAFGSGGGDYSITISGGTLSVLAGGDGLDSNGTIALSGGTVVVSSIGMADGALDYDGGCTITGGILFAASAGNMTQTPTGSNQNVLAVGFDQSLAADTYIQLTDGETEYVFRLTGTASSAVFSAPELTAGQVWTVSYGGDYSGSSENGLCTGGSYTGGTQLAQITLEEGVSTYGQTGGMGGGMGRGGGGGMAADGAAPPDGATPADGSVPQRGGGPGGDPARAPEGSGADTQAQ